MARRIVERVAPRRGRAAVERIEAEEIAMGPARRAGSAIADLAEVVLALASREIAFELDRVTRARPSPSDRGLRAAGCRRPSARTFPPARRDRRRARPASGPRRERPTIPAAATGRAPSHVYSIGIAPPSWNAGLVRRSVIRLGSSAGSGSSRRIPPCPAKSSRSTARRVPLPRRSFSHVMKRPPQERPSAHGDGRLDDSVTSSRKLILTWRAHGNVMTTASRHAFSHREFRTDSCQEPEDFPKMPFG